MFRMSKDGLLILVAVACGFGLSARPWMLARDESEVAARKVRRAQIDEARMARERTEEGRLGTELGKEELLRSQGYHRKGERPLAP